jgi:hypothetical protein
MFGGRLPASHYRVCLVILRDIMAQLRRACHKQGDNVPVDAERNDLGWALIYIVIAAVATAVLNAIGFVIREPAMQEAMRGLEDQFGGQPLPPGFGTMIGGGSLTGAIIDG